MVTRSSRKLACASALIAIGVSSIARDASAGAPTPGDSPGRERDVTLDELLAHAEAHAPRLALARQALARGAAEREGAAPIFRHDPTLDLALGPRFVGDRGRDVDFSAHLAQPIEIAGERGLRSEVAEKLEARLGAELERERWSLRTDVIAAYARAVVAHAGRALAARAVESARALETIAKRRLAAGDASAIEVRLAAVDLAEARQAEIVAEGELRAGRIVLAELTGWSLEAPPMIPAELGPPRHPPELAELFARAEAQHPELRARRAFLVEAEARVALADREAWPVPTIGVEVAREGALEEPASVIVLGTVGLALPLWQANRGERAKAHVEASIAELERSTAARALRARLALAHEEVARATERLQIFTASVAPSLEDNLELLRRGFEAGELPLYEVALARDRFLRAQRAQLEARADQERAFAELESAAGVVLSDTGGAR